MHRVKWFHVLLDNSPNLTSVICLHIVCSIWPIDRIPSGVITLGPGINCNDGVLHIPQISKAGVLPSESLTVWIWYESFVCSIWPIDRTISGSTTLEPGSNGNVKVLDISQISKTRASLSVCLMSYPGNLLAVGGRSYPSAEMLLVYSTAFANWTGQILFWKLLSMFNNCKGKDSFIVNS